MRISNSFLVLVLLSVVVTEANWLEDLFFKREIPYAICGVYEVPCVNGTMDYYHFYGKQYGYFKRVEIVVDHFNDTACKVYQYSVQKVYQTYDYLELAYDNSSIILPVTMKTSFIFMKFNKAILLNETKCTKEYTTNEWFNIEDNSCTSAGYLYDYKSLITELGGDIYERIYFTPDTAEFNMLHRKARRVDSSSCTDRLSWWQWILYVIIGSLFLILLILVIVLIMIYRRKRRFFIPLSTDDGEGSRRVGRDLTLDSYVFTLNTYDRVQQEL